MANVYHIVVVCKRCDLASVVRASGRKPAPNETGGVSGGLSSRGAAAGIVGVRVSGAVAGGG